MHRALSRTVQVLLSKEKEEINAKADSSKKNISFIGIGVLATSPRMSRLVSDIPILHLRLQNRRLSKKQGVLNASVVYS